MIPRALTAVFLALFAVAIFAQTQTTPTPSPKPAPTPPSRDDEAIRVSTTLIQADVTVTDKKGNVVTDLRPEEFEIYENGKKQKLTNFSFISIPGADVPQAASTAPSRKSSKPDRDSIPIPPAKLGPEQVRRTYALVVDDLGLSFPSVKEVQLSLRSFINKQMQDGDLVAIIRTGSGLGAMQSFTSDRRLLLAAVDKIRWNSQGRGGINTIEPITQGTVKDLLNEQTSAGGGGGGSQVAGTDEDRAFNEEMSRVRNENFAIGTLGALRYIIPAMRELPGRKSMMLFSEGFQLSQNANDRTLDQMRVLADLANRSSVIIYTLDPRGLVETTGLVAEDNTWGYPSGNFGVAPDALTRRQDARRDAFTNSQMSLQFLAAETGGFAYLNQNRVEYGMAAALRDQSSYYLLGYQPDEDTFDPKRKNRFNNIDIRVSRPGLKIRYRSGFYGLTDEQMRIGTTPQTPQQRLFNALTSPFGSSEIKLSLYPVFENDPTAGNMIQALLFIDGKDLKFEELPNGNRKISLDLVAVTFGDNGSLVDQLGKTYEVEVSEKVQQRMIANGFVYTLTVPVKKAGAYQFRIALRDIGSDRLGSASEFINVPDVRKKLSLSNLVLDNFTADEWQRIRNGVGKRDDSERSVMLDAARRVFKRGTILRYDYIAYNPNPTHGLTTRMRLIRDGKIVYEEPERDVDATGAADPARLAEAGALSLGKNLEPGTYLVQITIADKVSKKKFATQFVEFDLVD